MAFLATIIFSDPNHALTKRIKISPLKSTKPKLRLSQNLRKDRIGYAAWYARYGDTCDPFPHIITASGKELDDEDYTCAIWDYKFGTVLKVTNLETGASVQVTVTDRGPSKKLYKEKNRIIDLSKRAFSTIASLSQGVTKVQIAEVK